MIGIPNLFNLLSKAAVGPIFPVVGLRVNTHSTPSSCPLLTSFISLANSCLVLFVKPVLPTFDSIPILPSRTSILLTPTVVLGRRLILLSIKQEKCGWFFGHFSD